MYLFQTFGNIWRMRGALCIWQKPIYLAACNGRWWNVEKEMVYSRNHKSAAGDHLGHLLGAVSILNWASAAVGQLTSVWNAEKHELKIGK